MKLTKRSSWVLWAILIILLIVMYVRSALAVASETTIIQTEIESFYPEMLNEKNPILITSKIVDIDELIKNTFAFGVTIKKEKEKENKTQKTVNMYSYMIVHNDYEAIMTIQRPGGQPVSIIVPAYNALIIPFRWKILEWNQDSNNNSSEVRVTCINTLFGAFNKFLIA